MSHFGDDDDDDDDVLSNYISLVLAIQFNGNMADILLPEVISDRIHGKYFYNTINHR